MARTLSWDRILIVSALVMGALLRLLWLQDIEYKGDEQWMLEHVLAIAHGAPLPWIGNPSSVGTPNPGMSVWVFVFLRWISGAETPVGLSTAVAVLGFAAQVLLLVWTLTRAPREEREPWLWAWALSSVAFNAIQLQRKIWAPSVLPIFTVGALWAWSARSSRRGSFAWGALLPCLAQIHLAGFYLGFVWGLWALVSPQQRRAVHWVWVAVGAALTSWPLIPWALILRELHAHGSAGGWQWTLDEALSLKFWHLFWMTDATGVQEGYSLGWRWFDVWRRPFGVTLALFFCGWMPWAVLALYAKEASLRAWQWFKRQPRSLEPDALGVVRTGFWSFGAALTASATPIQRHHLGVVFPLTHLWVVLAWTRGWRRVSRWVLAVLFIAMAWLSLQFLIFIHTNGGAPGGDYGVSYSHQVR